MAQGGLVRVAGAHDALGSTLAWQAGFQAVWASSFEISASRCLPDASVLTMTEYLAAATNMQKAVGIPVVADVDTGYGNNLNVAHMVREYEAGRITAVCIEDKVYPKVNSFAATSHDLLPVSDFARRIGTAKAAQRGEDFYVIARTEALINGLGVEEALKRCYAYAEAGADAVLIHSKKKDQQEIVEFLDGWDGRLPVVVVPTTYPQWSAAEAEKHGASVVIYANQGLRATVQALRETFRTICQDGTSLGVEDVIAPVSDIFALQKLDEWLALEA
ncbi:isocitrate lyase/phosphoenolpyruvate mutase family protein [Streptomyces sp. CB01881]|uniref:isocitrate lyase/phosphoenolpyruvate mutase family protein n=1 Tax=Streptomyces sp. CB01881 TaxID=2078691 RepID=UPI000CDCA973|nr:isocitrate lyase/phosphoenolpyruvate mutase family protein [Streptomyces sp. CB01881]AUY54679.1 phosphoenolpyruvate phosphomutase [Streptomyces sp. CB01881]TYC69282.1 phosphoenolpyruvate phosphomutase [Streptomyces sp. CB01881]